VKHIISFFGGKVFFCERGCFLVPPIRGEEKGVKSFFILCPEIPLSPFHKGGETQPPFPSLRRRVTHNPFIKGVKLNLPFPPYEGG